MTNLTSNYEFLKHYVSKCISSIHVTPYLIPDIKMVSNQVVVNFGLEKSLLFKTGYGPDCDTLFNVDGVLFTISEVQQYTPWSNLGGFEMTTHLINEKINDIVLYYDVIENNDESGFQYPVGVIFKTKRRSISISRDIMDCDCLHFNDKNGSTSDFFTFGDICETYPPDESSLVKRFAFDFATGILKCTEEETIYPEC